MLKLDIKTSAVIFGIVVVAVLTAFIITRKVTIKKIPSSKSTADPDPEVKEVEGNRIGKFQSRG